MNIGRNIRYTLSKKGIKPYKMAEEIGISQGNLYDILNGKNKNPRIYTIKKIANYLDVSIGSLVED